MCIILAVESVTVFDVVCGCECASVLVSNQVSIGQVQSMKTTRLKRKCLCRRANSENEEVTLQMSNGSAVEAEL